MTPFWLQLLFTEADVLVSGLFYVSVCVCVATVNLCPLVATVAIVLIYCYALGVYIGDPITFFQLELKHLMLTVCFSSSLIAFCHIVTSDNS